MTPAEEDVLDNGDRDELEFVTSSFSGGGDCVAVSKSVGGEYLVKHSQRELAPIPFTRAEWKAFVAGVKANEFDF